MELQRNTVCRDVNYICRTWTAFESFNALLDAKGGYRPSLDCSYAVFRYLASMYDHSQQLRGDDRRAYRYNKAA